MGHEVVTNLAGVIVDGESDREGLQGNRCSVFSFFKALRRLQYHWEGGDRLSRTYHGAFPLEEAVIMPGSCLALGNPDVGIAADSLVIVSGPVSSPAFQYISPVEGSSRLTLYALSRHLSPPRNLRVPP